MAYWIGTDLGGTNVVCGLLNDEGRVVRTAKRSTNAGQGATYVLGVIEALWRELLEEENLSFQDIAAAGIGVPGIVDAERGMSIVAANLKWSHLPVASLMTDHTGIPVYIENDVRMFTYGEAVSGAGRGCRHVLGITIGTGIANAYVSDGILLRGGGLMAGEMGHVTIDGLSELCGCGRVGCLETAVSATGMARRARQEITGGARSVMRDYYEDIQMLQAADISRAYDEGDELAIRIMEETAELLADTLAVAVPVLSPDMIVIGGGVAMSGERFLAPLKDRLYKLIHPMYAQHLRVSVAQHIDEAGIIGSALFAKGR